MKNFYIGRKQSDSAEKEKMSKVNILTKEQYKSCVENGRMNKAMAQRITDRNFREVYK